MKALSSLPGLACRALAVTGIAAGLSLTSASTAVGGSSVTPYLEVQQVLSADLNDSDVLTYTALAAGINGQANTRRMQAQIAYRYEHRISWNDNISNDSLHSGIAQLHYTAVPRLLSLDAGALATHTRGDGLGPVFGFQDADDGSSGQIYSAYAGPTVSTQVGPLSVGAAYRLGYVKVDDGSPRATGGYDSSVSHNLSGSVGMGPGELPFGWTVGAGYAREETNRLDQQFEGKYVRGDVVVPVSPTLAVTAGAGFEDLQTSQTDIKRDANGNPIVTPDGELVEDPSKPRLLTYDESGFIWDAGVIWRPSRRTELQARVGQRYGGTTVTGSLSHQLNRNWGMTATVYDTFSSFGMLVVKNVSNLPTNFNAAPNPLTGGFGSLGGCVFGAKPGTGTCFDDALLSINGGHFRNRGANLILSGETGPWSLGFGGGYHTRKYETPGLTADGLGMVGRSDDSFSLSASAGRKLSPNSGLNLDAYASWYDSGVANSDAMFSTGASVHYYRSMILDRLQGYAAAGIYTSDYGDSDQTVATGLVGLRYSF